MSDVVVITGASGGIGRATARRFAQDGARIALLARGEAGLEGIATEIEERGAKALVLPTDVADADQVEAAAQAAESELGPIDIWVNDAMATIYAEFLDVEPDEYRRATDVTYHGMVWGTRAALKRMAARNRGTIVQVGSALAFRGIPLQAPYCGAKHACKGFTESVITEIKHHGWDIQVTMVHLAGFNTTQFTWGRTKLPRPRWRAMRPSRVRTPSASRIVVRLTPNSASSFISVGMGRSPPHSPDSIRPRRTRWICRWRGTDG